MRTSVCLRWFVVPLVVLAAGGLARADEAWIELITKNLDAWKEPAAAWEIVGDAGLNADNPKRLSGKPGPGAIFNGPKGSARDLITKQKFGDIEARVEFLVAKGSNSGVKFEGLYEIQIFDSHGKKEPTASDCGGIYPRAELKPTYRHIDKGFPPKVNAAKPAGEWQTLDVIFQAPRFDKAGKKVANAKFVKVVLNGQTIHEDVEVPYPTGHAWHDKEIPSGPLLLQGDHGPVAFRNVRVREYQPPKKNP